MRGLALALISAGMLAACGQGGGASNQELPNVSTGHYRAEATVTSAAGVSMPLVMYRDGDKSRTEFSTGEGQIAIVNGGAGGESFVLITRDGQTMGIRGTESPFGSMVPTVGQEPVNINARRIGACEGAGERGSEWAHTEEGGEQNAICITEDGIVLRAKQGERTMWETSSVSRGRQDAALFAVPAGVQLVDGGAMMGQMGQMMQQGANGGVTASPELCQTLRQAGAPADALSRAGC